MGRAGSRGRGWTGQTATCPASAQARSAAAPARFAAAPARSAAAQCAQRESRQPRCALRRTRSGRRRGRGLSRRSSRGGRIRRRHARLGRAEEPVAGGGLLLGRLDLVGRALVHERGQPQHVPHVVERVSRERLPVEEVPDRLHAGEAGAARGRVRLVARGRTASRRALVRRDRAAAVVDRLQQLAERLGKARRVLRQEAQLVDLLGRLQHRAATHHGRLAERLERRQALGRERPQSREEGVELVGGRLEVAQHRRLRLGEVAEAAHVGLELRQEGGQAPEALPQLLAPRRRDLGRLARLAHETDHVLLAVLQGSDDRVGVADELLDRGRLAAEDAQGLARFAKRGMRAAQHLAEIAGAAREAGTQLAHDQPEAVAIGPAHDVGHQVDCDRGTGLLHGQAPAVGEPLVGGARLAVHEVLTDERLRADLAACVLAQVGQPRLRNLGLHERNGPAPDLGDLERRRLSRAHAGDLEVAALGEAERVVEEQLVCLAARVLVLLRAHRQSRSADEPED